MTKSKLFVETYNDITILRLFNILVGTTELVWSPVLYKYGMFSVLVVFCENF